MNRADLAEMYESATAPWKTFVVESHIDVGHLSDLSSALEGVVVETDDAFLHELRVLSDLRFFVDHLDGRFWSVHTASPTASAAPAIKHMIETRRELDFVWLPSSHLRHLWPGTPPRMLRSNFSDRRFLDDEREADTVAVQVTGRQAGRWIEGFAREAGEAVVAFDRSAVVVADPQFGYAKEAVNRLGTFSANGDSFSLHQEITRGVVERYRRIVDAAEQWSLRWHRHESGGGTLAGAPILIRFSRDIDDLERFAEALLSSREPFRLWGLVIESTESTVEATAVDLHVGHRLHIEIGRRWLRVHLYYGGCGNSIARLASNLQHHFDGALRFEDAALEDALSKGASA